MINYKSKYLKYKTKYLKYKNKLTGGAEIDDMNSDKLNDILEEYKFHKDTAENGVTEYINLLKDDEQINLLNEADKKALLNEAQNISNEMKVTTTEWWNKVIEFGKKLIPKLTARTVELTTITEKLEAAYKFHSKVMTGVNLIKKTHVLSYFTRYTDCIKNDDIDNEHPDLQKIHSTLKLMEEHELEFNLEADLKYLYDLTVSYVTSENDLVSCVDLIKYAHIAQQILNERP